MNSVRIAPPSIPQYGDQLTPSMFNARMATAQASGDPRFAMKELDRAGMSRGAGQRQQAGIRAASSVADGIADAYSQQAQDAVSTAMNAMQAQQGQEQFAQALGALQRQNAYANAMALLQRTGLLRGLIG